jgi:large subunit ribosomal protein L3
MKVILGKKIGMTQVFLPTGEVVPVTRVLAGPCTVTQVRKDASSIQLGFGGKKEFRMNKSQVGHLSGLSLHDELREFTLNKVEGIERGDEVTLDKRKGFCRRCQKTSFSRRSCFSWSQR